jgi:hypothetical protein
MLPPAGQIVTFGSTMGEMVDPEAAAWPAPLRLVRVFQLPGLIEFTASTGASQTCAIPAKIINSLPSGYRSTFQLDAGFAPDRG